MSTNFGDKKYRNNISPMPKICLFLEFWAELSRDDSSDSNLLLSWAMMLFWLF